MGAPIPEMQPAEDATAEALLSSLKTISASERRKHASVFNYWLTIRGNHPLPPIRDLDPLEISDAGPCSVLLEMIGGEDADIRHLGQAISLGPKVDRVSDAPNPSLLSCIGSKLPIVAATKQPFAFEEEFATDDGSTRCWVTLLPFSASGALIDFVYGFVSLDPPPGLAEEAQEAEAEEIVEANEPDAPEAVEAPEPEPEEIEPVAEAPTEEEELVAEAVPDEAASEEQAQTPESKPEEEPAPAPAAAQSPGFSTQLLESLAHMTGFYGRTVDVEPSLPSEAAQQDEPAPRVEPKNAKATVEGSLQSKLAEVRAKTDEARMAKLRANAALYEGLGAAYDFALDAEESPEEYLKIVQAQGLKIQLRSPMAPVVKLAFDGMCDDTTIAQLEAVLGWALEQELPRGSLAERIQEAGGIAPILHGQAKAA